MHNPRPDVLARIEHALGYEVGTLIRAARGLASADADAFTAALQRVLTLAKVATVARDQVATYRIESSVALQAPGISGQPSSMKFRLLDAGGAVLYEGEQKSMLMTPVTAEQWRALGEGAGYRVIEPVRLHLARAEAARASQLKAPVAPPVDKDKVSSASELGKKTVEVQLETAKAMAQAVKRAQDN